MVDSLGISSNLPNMKFIDKKVAGESICNDAIYHHDSAQEKIEKHKAAKLISDRNREVVAAEPA
jgi:hypothetical protein